MMRASCLAAVLVLVGASHALGQTQAEMNADASAHLRATEAEQRQVLDELRGKAREKTDALATLEAAQRAWEAYRDAHVRALWPSADDGRYGTVNPMCVATTKAELTRARTRELRAMLKPVEGDACGSRWPE
jgi:uncharacterized protein YecT (DUF1311 family)